MYNTSSQYSSLVTATYEVPARFECKVYDAHGNLKHVSPQTNKADEPLPFKLSQRNIDNINHIEDEGGRPQADAIVTRQDRMAKVLSDRNTERMTTINKEY